MQELQQWKYVDVLRLYCSYASNASFASRQGKSFVTWHKLISWLFLQKWNGSFFVKTCLQSLGLRYQLSHSGAPCPCSQAGLKNFIIFDISGPHHLAIDYCQCGDEPLSNWAQLLCERWFPATLSLFSPLNASKHSTSWLYKERQACTTITTPFFNSPITQACQHPL